MTARSPRASAAPSSSRIAVLLPVPVVPMSLKCLVSSSRGQRHAGERDAPARACGAAGPRATRRRAVRAAAHRHHDGAALMHRCRRVRRAPSARPAT